jgi:hypothetical protein
MDGELGNVFMVMECKVTTVSRQAVIESEFLCRIFMRKNLHFSGTR